jgi:hypothetical protein
MRSVILFSCLILSCGLVQAGQIEVDFLGAVIPTGPGSTVTIPTALPALLGGNADAGISNYAGDILFLKFRIPDISEVSVIDSFVINVSVFDNGDGGGESGDVDFALPGTNIVLAGPAFTTLNHITSSLPLTLSYSLNAAQIAQVFPTIADGNFRIRIIRDTGDFEVGGASAQIDATLTSAPEPASVLLLLSGLGCVAGCYLKRERR